MLLIDLILLASFLLLILFLISKVPFLNQSRKTLNTFIRERPWALTLQNHILKIFIPVFYFIGHPLIKIWRRTSWESKLVFSIFLVIVSLWMSLFGSFNYRETILIETPEGLKKASVVREVTYKKGKGTTWGMTGEALVLDLGKDRGLLFGLMPHSLYGDPVSELGFFAQTLNPCQYPTLVRFKNLNDPLSLQLVYSSACYSDTVFDAATGGTRAGPTKLHIRNRFKKIFDEDIRIKEVTIEKTWSFVTHDEIVKWLPWLPTSSSEYITGKERHTVDEPIEDKILRNRLLREHLIL